MEEKSNDNTLTPVLAVHIKSCKFTNVTVFKDRAEVTRTISFIPTATGELELVITHLCSKLDKESIRVKGHQMCQIVEVSNSIGYEEETPLQDMVPEISGIETKLQELKSQIATIVASLNRIKAQKLLMQQYVESSLTTRNEFKTFVEVEEARKLLAYFAEDMTALDTQELGVQEHLKELNNQCDSLQRQRDTIKQLTSKASQKPRGEVRQFKQAHVVVHIPALLQGIQAPVEIQMTYVVYEASWKPSYDIRITNNASSSTMALTYYADVIQATGEDWNQCAELCLSTSNPAIGSTPPPLPIKRVVIEQPYNYYNSKKTSKETSYIKSSARRYSDADDEMADRSSMCLMEDTMDITLDVSSRAGGGGAPAPSAITAGIKSGQADTSPAVFVIPRKVTIASDSKPHKVTIAQIHLSPQLVHYIAPSVSTSVYLQAKTKNSSAYPLLPSNKVSIFLDGNFVSTSELKRSTSPNDSFTLYLGVDQGFKAEYLPSKVSEKTKGWMGGSSIERKYEFATVLHNAKQLPYRVIIAEVLPISGSDKITVELLQPPPASLVKAGEAAVLSSNQEAAFANLAAISEAAAGAGGSTHSTDGEVHWPKDCVSLNKTTNSLVWLKTIQPGEKVQLNFSYRIIWPQGSQISVNQD